MSFNVPLAVQTTALSMGLSYPLKVLFKSSKVLPTPSRCAPAPAGQRRETNARTTLADSGQCILVLRMALGGFTS